MVKEDNKYFLRMVLSTCENDITFKENFAMSRNIAQKLEDSMSEYFTNCIDYIRFRQKEASTEYLAIDILEEISYVKEYYLMFYRIIHIKFKRVKDRYAITFVLWFC